MASKKKKVEDIKYDKCDHVWDVISKKPLSKEFRDFIKIEKKCRRCDHIMIDIKRKCF